MDTKVITPNMISPLSSTLSEQPRSVTRRKMVEVYSNTLTLIVFNGLQQALELEKILLMNY